jgi:hypothetical protein
MVVNPVAISTPSKEVREGTGRRPGLAPGRGPATTNVGNELDNHWQGTGQTLAVNSTNVGGVCSTDLQLDTSTNGLKQVYTSPEAIY